MDGVVAVAQSVDPERGVVTGKHKAGHYLETRYLSQSSPFVSISNDRSQGLVSSPQRPVEHLGLELAELHLQFRVVIGKGLHHGGVEVPNIRFIRSQILVSYQSNDLGNSLTETFHTKIERY